MAHRLVLDVLVAVEPRRKIVGVLAVGLGAQGEGLEALEELERVERRDAPTHVAQGLDAREEDENRVRGIDAKDRVLDKEAVVIRLLRGGDQRELERAIGLLCPPVEVRPVDDDAAN